ncbi:MAG: aminoacyl-histidine dipeptidase [Bacteroidaceae bacterium]|nr:aminoacyl-histidine dipeptidase [Bacteroidaceae bacterium]
MEKIELKPALVFDMFARINAVPRPSKREEKMIAFLKEFGEGLGLETKVDETGNVLICKPATPGMEQKPTVILQSHMDMVCEKNNDIEFDFDRDAIQTYIDGEWMKAKGTTLGADDGIGCAMEMAILADNTLKHGPLECVFTRDEETGLTGAEGMKPGFMSGQMLINLDSEDEGELFVSCAGGCRTEATFRFTPEASPAGAFFLRLTIKGLTGGHSGDDIDKKRANTNKLLVRYLYDGMKKWGLRLSDIQAGGLHNAIPREATCLVCIPNQYKEQARVDWNLFAAEVEEEFCSTEKTMEFLLESAEPAATVLPEDVNRRLITALQGVDNGVYAMSQDIALVETSSNLASIKQVEPGVIFVNSSQRSSLLSNRKNMAHTVAAVFELAGADVQTGEGYPGWAMNPKSELLRIAREQYVRLFQKEPVVRGIHAGLECGLFSEKYPGLDMVSFGPTLRGVHSPDERLLIPTVDMVWRHLLAILENV